MKGCTGTPAELCALPYVEGSLTGPEAERFEDHYFDCPVCLAYLQTVQAMSAGLARLPAAEAEEPARTMPLRWPVMAWAMSAAAAVLLLAAVFSYRALHSGPRASQVARSAPTAAPQTTPRAAPATPPAARIRPSQMADLSLPAFVAPNLRGAGEDEQFAAGMKAYRSGDCRNAVAALAKVPPESDDASAASFYCAACEMHLRDFDAAAAGMRKVENAGDSPQQESALYYEAQIALATDNAAAAHRYLLQAIALKGDLEQKARNEDRKVLELVGEPADDGTDKPENGAR